MLSAWYFIFGLEDRECFACYTSERKEAEILDILKLSLTQKDQEPWSLGDLEFKFSCQRLVQVDFDSHITKIGPQLYMSHCVAIEMYSSEPYLFFIGKRMPFFQVLKNGFISDQSWNKNSAESLNFPKKNFMCIIYVMS